MHVRGAGLITERGICRSDEDNILDLFPEKNNHEPEV